MIWVSSLEAHRRGRNAHLAQPGAQSALAGDERRTSRRAALLGVVIGEHHSFLGDAIDVGRAIAHHPHRVGTDISLTDVVAEDDEHVWFLAG